MVAFAISFLCICAFEVHIVSGLPCDAYVPTVVTDAVLLLITALAFATGILLRHRRAFNASAPFQNRTRLHDT